MALWAKTQRNPRWPSQTIHLKSASASWPNKQKRIRSALVVEAFQTSLDAAAIKAKARELGADQTCGRVYVLAGDAGRVRGLRSVGILLLHRVGVNGRGK